MHKFTFFTLAAVLALLIGAQTACRADIPLGDAANYAVLYTGTKSLQVNNGPGPIDLAISGNTGIQTGGALQVSGPLTIQGNIDFAGTPNPTTNPSGGNITITGTYTGGNTNVATDIANLQTLSTNLGNLPGAPLTVNINNAQSQTILASAGTLDPTTGDRVFSVSSFNFGGGSTLTIDGQGLGNNVVFNFPGSEQFKGTIVLTGGLTPDQILWNFPAGGTLQVSTNGATVSGIFLDPGGTMSTDHAIINGRFFGGDNSNMSIVSGAQVNAPPASAVPEPSTMAIAGLGALGFIGYGLRRRKSAGA
jgi:hypothetical protein